MKRLSALILAVALLSGVLGGCSQTSAPASPSEAGSSTSIGASTPAPSTESGSPSSIVRGGTLIAGKTVAWSNLNPTKTNARADDRYVVGQIYEPLIGVDDSGNFVPQLATSWDVTNATTIVLTLRDDVVFHDGTPFNAEAVKYVLDWYKSPECAYVFASELADIESIEAIGEHTVQINLSKVNSAVLGALANVSGYMISPAAIETYGDDLSTNAVGTGPFILKEAVEGDHITLVRNEHYYELGEDGQPLPYLDEVIIEIITEDAVKTTNLQTRDIKLVDYNNSVSSTLTLQSAADIVTEMTQATDIYALVINSGDPQLKDLRVRQAVAYAINREELVAAMTEGLGEPGSFITSKNQWYYDDYNPYNYDPEKAKALLADAGYADGIDITVRYITREPDATIAQLIQAQVKASGINVTLEGLERLAWQDLHNAKQSGELGFSKFGIPRVDPYMQFTQLGNYITKNSPTYEEYGEAIMTKMQEITGTYDINERKKLISEFQKLNLDNCAQIYAYKMPRYTSWDASVKGIKVETDGSWNLKAVWLSE